jgi:hypothetical protein
MSREGRAARLVEPDEMVPPLLYVVSREADNVNGCRFDANLWDPSLPPPEAAPRRPPRWLRKCILNPDRARDGHSSGNPTRRKPA